MGGVSADPHTVGQVRAFSRGPRGGVCRGAIRLRETETKPEPGQEEDREEEHDEILIELNEVLRGFRKEDPNVALSLRRLVGKITAHQRAEDVLFEQAYGIYVGELSSV